MPKVTDIKQYWREIATKAGLDEEQLKQVSGLIDNEKFAAAVNQNFKPLPDYSHDLDDVRNRTKQEKDDQYRKWHEEETKKYNEYVASLEELNKYRTTFGSLDGNGNGNQNGNQGGNQNGNQNGGAMVDGKYVSKEELEARLNDVLGRRDNTYLDYLEIRERHMSQFGKPLDRKAFEAAYKEHPEWGGLETAYDRWIAPDMEKAREAKAKADADRRYEEGVRDGFTRRAVPADAGPKTFSPLFDRKTEVDKMTPAEQERHSRQSFFEGLAEKNPNT